MFHFLGLLLLILFKLLSGLFLCLLFILLLVLFIPFRYRLAGHRYEVDTAMEGSADWLFGLVSIVFSYDGVFGFRLRLMLFSRWAMKSFDIAQGGEPAGTAAGKTVRRIDKAGEKNHGEHKDEVKKKSAGRFKLTRDNLFILVHSGIRIIKKVMPQRVYLHCRIGFDDPADTGTFCAVLAPMQVFFRGNPEKYDIRILPVFEDTEATGRIDMQGRIMIWFIVWEALKLAISRPFRQDIFRFLKPHKAIAQGGYEHV